MSNTEYTIEKSESQANAYVLVDTQLNMAIAAGSKKEMMRLKSVLSEPAVSKVLYM